MEGSYRLVDFSKLAALKNSFADTTVLAKMAVKDRNRRAVRIIRYILSPCYIWDWFLVNIIKKSLQIVKGTVEVAIKDFSSCPGYLHRGDDR